MGDIRRLLAFTDFYDDSMMKVETMQRFFSEMMSLYGVDNAFVEDCDYEDKYNQRLRELIEKIKKEKKACEWDYILVDEAQDWGGNEIELLMSLFLPEQIVIADGVDQFVRSTVKRDQWKKSNYELSTQNFTKSLRQKSNLVAFVNAFAQEAGYLDWNVEENEKLMGGKIIIKPFVVDAEFIVGLKDACLQQGNAMYDFLVLIPNCIGPNTVFQMQKCWKECGIPLFDGTSQKNRAEYSILMDEARIFNYNSCRGIEGWTVLCCALDRLVNEKMKMKYPSLRVGETEYDRQMRIKKEVYKWVLMPLTRAIDTLVITLNNQDSEVGKILYELSQKYDFIEWHLDK